MNFPHMVDNMSYGQLPPSSFGGGYNPGCGYPSAPPAISTPSFPVCLLFCSSVKSLYRICT